MVKRKPNLRVVLLARRTGGEVRSGGIDMRVRGEARRGGGRSCEMSSSEARRTLEVMPPSLVWSFFDDTE